MGGVTETKWEMDGVSPPAVHTTVMTLSAFHCTGRSYTPPAKFHSRFGGGGLGGLSTGAGPTARAVGNVPKPEMVATKQNTPHIVALPLLLLVRIVVVTPPAAPIVASSTTTHARDGCSG